MYTCIYRTYTAAQYIYIVPHIHSWLYIYYTYMYACIEHWWRPVHWAYAYLLSSTHIVLPEVHSLILTQLDPFIPDLYGTRTHTQNQDINTWNQDTNTWNQDTRAVKEWEMYAHNVDSTNNTYICQQFPLDSLYCRTQPLSGPQLPYGHCCVTGTHLNWDRANILVD